MPSRTVLTERDFESLLRRARTSGVQVELRDDPDCRTLVTPGRRHVVVAMRAGLAERYHMLCAALRELHQSELVARDPWAAAVARSLPVTTVAPAPADDADPSGDSLAISIDVVLDDADATDDTRQVDLAPLAAMRVPSGPVRALGDSLYEDPVTLRDLSSKHTAQAIADHLAASTTTDTAPSAPVCELCRTLAYGTLGALRLCRSHLYASVAGRLLPHEVLALRARHPEHPEVCATRYDAGGEIRRARP